MNTEIDWTHPGETPRACSVDRAHHNDKMAHVQRLMNWLSEHVKARDWYAVERIAKQLQQEDPERAFDHIDLLNFQFQAA